jgi:hypothetical protein
MRILFYQLLSLLLLGNVVHAQKIQWEKSYGGKQADYLTDVQPTADYGFILAGSSLSNKSGNKSDLNKGDFDYCIWKMDESGTLDWQRSYGGSGSDMLQSIKNTNDGGFVLAGVSNSSNVSKNEIKNDKKDLCRGGNDYWIVKLNAKGEEEWQKTIGGIGQEKLKTIVVTKDGGYIIGGSSTSNKSSEKSENGYGNLDYWVVKLNSKGEIEWQRTFGGLYYDELKSIEQTKDLGYIVGGVSNSPASGNKSENTIGNSDYWVLKIDSKGTIQWQKTIGGVLEDQLSIVHQSTYDDGFLLAGNSNSEATKSKKDKNENGSDFWIVKLDSQGTKVWEEKYNIGDVDILTSMIENKDHSILLGGYAQSEIYGTSRKEQNGINDYVAIKISDKGEELWRKFVGSAGEDVLQKAIETRDGGYLFAGTSNPTKPNSIPILSKNTSKKGNSLLQNNEKVKEVTSTISNSVNETKDKANSLYNNSVGDLSKKVNEKTGLNKEIISTPNNPLNGGLSLGSGKNQLPLANNKPIPPSKDKKTSFGSTDFWIVKIKDNDKQSVDKIAIEALPNPAVTFTNVIVGYDFEEGTATLVDLSGRVLKEFTIKERTVPVDLQGLPDGIYIVNIKTEKQSDGVKIIKSQNKN